VPEEGDDPQAPISQQLMAVLEKNNAKKEEQ